MLEPGELAPDFVAVAHDGTRVALADYRGRQVVVLFFYPKDNSLVCTREACAFRDAYADFLQAGAVVLGVSQDSAEDHEQFARSQRLPYPLLTDTDGSLHRAYGVRKTLGLFPGRVTFVIDRGGVVRMAFSAQLLAGRHVDDALAMVRSLVSQQ